MPLKGTARRQKRRRTGPAKRWSGNIIFRKGRDVYFDSVELDDRSRIRLGDFVDVDLENDASSVATIVSIWRKESEAKFFVEARWFHHPDEVKLKKPEVYELLDNELFESSVVDECPLSSIRCKVNIASGKTLDTTSLQKVDASELGACSESEKATYVCRWFYCDELMLLRPSLLFQSRLDTLTHSRRLLGVSLDTNNDESRNDRSFKLHQASKMLQLSSVPKTLPCRNRERVIISNSVLSGLRDGGCSLYLAGTPGTGKTATVYEVIRSIRDDMSENKLEPFDFVEINGLRLENPHCAYSEIYRGLTGLNMAPRRAGEILARTFDVSSEYQGESNDASKGLKKSPTGRMCVVLVDEMDHMVTRKQSVLYNLFDWSSRPNSWLVTIGIANTMDLPERLLSRIHSRIATRVVFRSYLSQEIENIINSRLKESEVFDPSAITLCGKKVASLTGDVRRALNICREAISIAANSEAEKVTMAHVQIACKRSQNNPTILAIGSLSLLEKLICLVLCRKLESGDIDCVRFPALMNIVQNLWKECGFKTVALSAMREKIFRPIKRTELLRACVNLELSKLVTMIVSSEDHHPKLQFDQNVCAEDVLDALRHDKECFPDSPGYSMPIDENIVQN